MSCVRKMAVVALFAAAPVLSFAGVAGATPSPNGPGQPGTGGGTGTTSCQNFPTTPGGSASSQSPFNPNGGRSVFGGRVRSHAVRRSGIWRG